jgi:hypothetical protein
MKMIARGSDGGRMRHQHCPAAGRKTGMTMMTTIVAQGGGSGRKMQLWRQHRQRATSTGGGDMDRVGDDNDNKDCTWQWGREDATSMCNVDRWQGQRQG